MGRPMKDSGVEWIGEIPADWEVSKFKYAMKKEKTLVGSYNGENVLSLTKQGVIVRDLENPTGKMPASFVGYQHAEKDDLLLCLFDIDVTPRCVGIVKNNGITSPAYSRYRVSKKFSKEFLNYFLTYIDDEKILLPYTKSLRNTLTDEYFGMVNVLYPSIEAQQKIATFLDQEATNIDSIIKKTQASIAAFKRYKQALITETVTKGLNPDVPMKDSGVEWIGMIPEHWDISKVKYLLGKKGVKIGPFGSALKSNEIKSSGPIKVYGQANLIRKDFTFGNKYIDLEKFNQLKNYEIEENDILISMMGTIGKCEIFPVGSHRGIMDSHLTKLNLCNEKVDSKFFRYSFSDSEITKVQLDLFSKGSIMSGLNSSIIKNIVVTLPPLFEQHRIVAFLDEKTAHIDHLIQNKEAMIEKLEAYKKSLIYEYVTGKKEVE